MEEDEEPELSLLVVPVDLPVGEEGEGEPEGRDEVHHPLPHHAPPKLGGAEEGMADHQHQVEQNEPHEQQSIPSHLCCHCIKTFAEMLLELKNKANVFQFFCAINTMIS